MAGAINFEDFGDLPLEPFQPRHIVFPSRSFGKTAPVSRSFQATWFNKFRWLHYDLAQDAARCFTCCKAIKDGRAVVTGVTDRAFVVKGFTKTPHEAFPSMKAVTTIRFVLLPWLLQQM